MSYRSSLTFPSMMTLMLLSHSFSLNWTSCRISRCQLKSMDLFCLLFSGLTSLSSVFWPSFIIPWPWPCWSRAIFSVFISLCCFFWWYSWPDWVPSKLLLLSSWQWLPSRWSGAHKSSYADDSFIFWGQYVSVPDQWHYSSSRRDPSWQSIYFLWVVSSSQWPLRSKYWPFSYRFVLPVVLIWPSGFSSMIWIDRFPLI